MPFAVLPPTSPVGQLGYASNETTAVTQFANVATAVPFCLLVVPPSSREVWIEWGCALGLVAPPVGGHGIISSVLYETTSGAVLTEVATNRVRSTDVATTLFCTQRGSVRVGPSTVVRRFALYGLAGKDAAATAFPTANFRNNLGQQKSWIGAMAR